MLLWVLFIEASVILALQVGEAVLDEITIKCLAVQLIELFEVHKFCGLNLVKVYI